ncbi:MAG TPA: TonB family protein [Blastocatellia bacterium]|nr:TonB family protein [Blastocatellia bacterium]
MQKLLAALIINLSFFNPLTAQTTPTPSQKGDVKSAELAEASRLSAQTVELYNKKQYDQAIPLARRALEIRERALGPGDALVGDSLQNLASLQLAKKNYGEALSLYKRALAILEKADGPDQAKLANTLDNLGWLYYADGNRGKTEESFKRSLTIREKALGPYHKDVALSLHLLAEFYQKEGKYAKAVACYKRALEIKEKALGPDHKEVGEMAMKCGCAMLQNREMPEARAMLKRADLILNHPAGYPDELLGPVLHGKATLRAEPEYPEVAKRRGISGAVVVLATVDEQGKVIEALTLCGNEILAAAAIEAARKWRFTPTLLNGQPVKVVGTIEFYFNL